MMLKELAGFIDNQIGMTLGTNFYIGELGAEQPDGIVLVTGISEAPDNELDTEYQVIDFYARYNNSESGYNKLKDIYDLLHRKTHYTFDIYGVYLSEALGQIEDMDRDLNQRKIWRLSVRFLYHRLTNVS